MIDEDNFSHNLGMYFALACNAGFSGKVNAYPKKPFGVTFNDEDGKKNEVDNFFAEQAEMRRKWKANKGRA